MSGFTPQGLANVLWGLARMQTSVPSGWMGTFARVRGCAAYGPPRRPASECRPLQGCMAALRVAHLGALRLNADLCKGVWGYLGRHTYVSCRWMAALARAGTGTALPWRQHTLAQP